MQFGEPGTRVVLVSAGLPSPQLIETELGEPDTPQNWAITPENGVPSWALSDSTPASVTVADTVARTGP